MFSIHSEFLKLDVAQDKSGHQAVAPPETLGRLAAKRRVRQHVDWIENSLNERPRKKGWEGQVQIKVLSPSFGNGITALFGCVWVADSALFCWILPR